MRRLLATSFALRWITHWLMLVLCLFTSLHAQDADLGKFLGKPVASVDFLIPGEQLSPDVLIGLRELVTLKVGQPLTRAGLRTSLQAIYATRRFSTVEVEAQEDPAGIAVTFVGRPNFFIGNLSVRGEPRPPSANQLINASKLELGQQFSEDDLEGALQRMTRVMKDNGYYLAKITPHVNYEREGQLVSILFEVDRGPHTRVGEIKVTGDPGYPPEKIMDIVKIHTGDQVSTSRTARALRRLRSRYQKDERLEADVSISTGQYHLESNRLDYLINVERGPKVEIRVEGASMRRGLIKRYVPVFEENAVDDDLLNEGRRNIRDYWQTKGYFDVEVDFERRTVPEVDRKLVIFDVNRGERHKLNHVEIQGNEYFADDVLFEQMRITPASILLPRGLYSQTLLSRDVTSIENLYKANGFIEVQVEPTVLDDYQGEMGQMHVVINVTEGRQTLVNKLEIDGNKSFDDDRLSAIINTSEGQPYSEANMINDREAIVNFYFNNGFPDIRFDTVISPAAANRMDVKFNIVEGDRKFVNRMLVTGVENTRSEVITRELEIKEQEPLSQADIVETQRRLYDLGIFNEVNIAVQNPEGTLDHKNLILEVEEAKRYTFSYGFGLEVQTGDAASDCANLPQPEACQPQGRAGVSPRVSFDLTRINFLGRDHTILFKSRLGRLQQRLLVSYEAPYWFDRRNLTLTFTTFFDKTQDVRTFTAERIEGSAQIQHLVDRPTTLLYRITYRRVQVDPTTLQVSPEDIPLLSRPVRVGFPSVTYIRDTRDNPLESTKGAYNTADVSIAAGIFGSESSFARLFFQNATYYAFGKGKPERRWVFARSTRVGIEVPYGSPSNSFVPLPERFFAGGSNSHRGFAINQAGPRDLFTGFPVGGLSIFVNNLELRTPPIVLPLPFIEDNLSVVAFHDAGNVFATARDLVTGLKRFTQPSSMACRDQSLCDFRYTSHAVGMGLRYRTPIGPVRADFGYNLTPTSFPIQNQARGETLHRFNFFFSIGQTF